MAAGCANPECRRQATARQSYCCVACADADEGQYEIRAHSPGCDRDANHGEPAELR